MSSTATSVGRRIKVARKEHLGYTQVELASQLVSRRGKQPDPVNVSRWERGDTEPSLFYVRQIAALTGLPVSWFFEEVAA